MIEAIIHGAVKRVRPKAMTVMAAFMGLMPIMWSAAAGADMMKRVAAPMVGGLATSFALELLVYPSIYFLWKWSAEVKHQTFGPPRLVSEAEELTTLVRQAVRAVAREARAMRMAMRASREIGGEAGFLAMRGDQ